VFIIKPNQNLGTIWPYDSHPAKFRCDPLNHWKETLISYKIFKQWSSAIADFKNSKF